MYYQQERFILNSSIGRLIIDREDPIGWREVDISIDRSSTSDTLFTEVKQSLEFYKTGKNYLDRLAAVEGSEAIVSLRREHFKGGRWRVRNEGFLDFSTRTWNYIKTSADYVENTFSETFKNNFKEQFELSRLEDINGSTLEPLELGVLNNTGHRILLQSRINQAEGEISNITELQDASNSLFNSFSAVPMLESYSSDSRVASFVSPSSFGLNFDNGLSDLPISQSLFYIASGGNGEKDINVKIEGTFNLDQYSISNNFSTDFIALGVYKFELLPDGTYKRIHPPESVLWESTGNDPLTFVNQEIDFSLDQNISISNNEALFLGWIFSANAVNTPLDIDIQISYPQETFLKITEESYFAPTRNDVVTLFDAVQRVVNIIDKDAVFESTLLSDKYKGVVLASGETVRNVLYEDSKPTVATTSFEDIYKFLFTLEPVGYDVTTVNGKNVIRLEPIEYFWNTAQKIDIGDSIEVEYDTDQSKLFSSIEIGYSESGENEEVYGLQVSHVVNTFTTPINSTNTVYNATNKWIASPEEHELTRRKPFVDFPDEDTQYDKNVLVYDCILENGVYSFREWEDDFTSVTGIFSPETFYNARFSPINCLLRHGKWFKSGLGKPIFQSQFIRFASTTGNKVLSTTLIDGNTYTEGDNVLISDLDDPILTADNVSLTTPYSESKEDQIRAIDNGERAAYSVVRFVDQRGLQGFGIITSCEIKDNIKLELKQPYGI